MVNSAKGMHDNFFLKSNGNVLQLSNLIVNFYIYFAGMI